MALADIYQLSMNQSADGEEIKNIFFYEKLAGGSDSQTLIDAFVLAGEGLYQNITCSVLSFDTVEAHSLGDPTDFWEETLGDTGLNVITPLPSYAALNFSLKLDTRAVRPGSKRVACIPEAATAFNVVTDATYLADVELFRIFLKTTLQEDSADAWRPIVVKRVKEEVVGTVPLRYTYRLPETDGELEFGHIREVLFNSRISHQVSRGNGR